MCIRDRLLPAQDISLFGRSLEGGAAAGGEERRCYPFLSPANEGICTVRVMATQQSSQCDSTSPALIFAINMIRTYRYSHVLSACGDSMGRSIFD